MPGAQPPQQGSGLQRFAQLYAALDAGTSTAAKLEALVAYWADAQAADAAWAVYFLAGGKPRQVVPTAVLRDTACAGAAVDPWLFEACYQAVGDLAETIALLWPDPPAQQPADPLADPPAGLVTPTLPEPLSQHPEGCAAFPASASLAEWIEQRLLPLRGLTSAEQSARLAQMWNALDSAGRFLLIKLIGGGFRVGVSKLLVQRSLAAYTGLDAKLLAQRLVGWTDARSTPSAQRWAALVAAADAAGSLPNGLPYPFFLAHPLQASPAFLASPSSPSSPDPLLGPLSDWLVEWKFDGIRAQLVKRQGQVWIWSRGEELISERFPEVLQAAAALPGETVVDGELLVWHAGQQQPAPFQLLQQRIGRKNLSKKLLAQAPVVFVAYDLLEWQGQDQRQQPQQLRRQMLESLLEGPQEQPPAPALKIDSPASPPTTSSPTAPPPGLPTDPLRLRLSPRVVAPDWATLALWRAGARERGMEGLMLKNVNGRYGSGRTRSEGLWWKWKLDPLTVDAVLIYAQAGHGRRAGVYTDYTFAVWSHPPADEQAVQAVLQAIARREPAQAGALQLLPFAKAYSGLSDAEFKAVDRVIRATTLEKFGPVRSVKPSLVFEIGFEGINRSPRHKSGLAVRFPRMLRLRSDKTLAQADSLATLQAMLKD